MQLQLHSPISLSRLVLTLGLSTAANLLSASFTQAKVPIKSTPPLPFPLSDSDIACPASFDECPNHATPNSQLLTQPLPSKSIPQTQSDRLHTPQIEERLDVQFSTQAADLLPSYEDLSPTYGKVRIREFRLAQGTDPESAPGPSQQDENERGKLKIPLGGGEDFAFGFGSLIQEPTALEGPTRDLPVSAQSTRLAVISVAAHARQRLTENQFLLLELIGDPKLLGLDFSYTNNPTSLPGAFSVNFFNQRSLSPAFDNGEIEVDLPNGDEPWVHRIGGGIEYETPLTPGLDIAAALNYQRISVRDALFSNSREPVDELGNRLTVSDDGRDDLLTLSLTGFLDEVDGEGFALQGTRVQFGMDQSIPVGDADIFFNRLVGNVTQFIPLRIFTGEPGAVVLNLQGGYTIGDTPPYESLSLGGSSSVRGFSKGEVGSGSSFIQATAEYRFPLFSFNAFKAPIGMGGVLFVDYASDLGTADEVIGDPAEVRDKPGDGLGFGFGIHSITPFGLFRFELGFNDDGGSNFHFAVGDRF